jgi:hypothetical protein
MGVARAFGIFTRRWIDFFAVAAKTVKRRS